VINLTPNATAAHPASRFVGMPWSEDFNCWHLVQAVQREVFGRHVANLPIATEEDQTAALRVITRQFPQVHDAPRDGDILSMIGPHGLHVGVMVGARLLHNVGGREPDGTVKGAVMASELRELGSLGYGHVKVWRAA
jgi:hypothetical protein